MQHPWILKQLAYVSEALLYIWDSTASLILFKGWEILN